MKEIKIEAKTITDAVEKGLKELNLTREQAEVEIIQEEKRGILGIGSRKACVLVREKKWTGGNDQQEHRPEHRTDHRRETSRRPQERRERPGRHERRERPQCQEREERRPVGAERKPFTTETFDLKAYDLKLKPTDNALEDSKNLLSRIMTLSGITCALGDCRFDPEKKIIYISFSTPDSGLFLYDDARGLLSLQYLVSSIINRNRPEKMILKLDTGDFWSKTESHLQRDVEHAIGFIKKTGNPYRLRPMSSQFRKFVHDMIKEKYPEFQTYSEGEAQWRKVVIKPGKREISEKSDAGKTE